MKITFIGGGNMAGAIIGGLTRDGFAAKDVNIVEPVVAAREQLAQRFGVTVAGSVAVTPPTLIVPRFSALPTGGRFWPSHSSSIDARTVDRS